MPDEELSAFARRVKELRERKGWSQAQLAARLGTSKMRVYRIEKDEVPAKLDLVEDLSRALGLRAIEFLAPILDSQSDAQVLEQERAERMERERRELEQVIAEDFKHSITRPRLRTLVDDVVRAGRLMSDEQLGFLSNMLFGWRQWNEGEIERANLTKRLRPAPATKRKERE